jgi:hypothetical protein
MGNGDGDKVNAHAVQARIVYSPFDFAFLNAPRVSFGGKITVRLSDGSNDGVTLDKALGDNSTQDVLGVLVAKLPTFRHNGRPGAFRAWLRAIAVNRLRRFERDRRNRGTIGGAALERHLDDRPDPSGDFTGSLDREDDRRALGALLRRVESAVEGRT